MNYTKRLKTRVPLKSTQTSSRLNTAKTMPVPRSAVVVSKRNPSSLLRNQTAPAITGFRKAKVTRPSLSKKRY
jgi:hypothetical protein